MGVLAEKLNKILYSIIVAILFAIGMGFVPQM